MLTNYQQRKQEVLGEYIKFENTVSDFVKTITEVGLPDPSQQFKTSFEDATRRAENIREDRFRLMIAGESKSGKSTFINAYLGIELLPMDVKQCTSSIIEIKYGDEFKLVATHAGGGEITLSGESDIRAYLQINGALDDNYRDIPVPTINHDILVRYGRKNKKETVIIPPRDLESFLVAPEIKAANIHNISNYDEKIKKYIKTKKENWKDIVVKIVIYFPFEDEALKGIEIIDSPGVCARGGVSEITSDYIENADAIMFLKPISGQALESTQFNDFMNNASVERNKSALFLVLTRATNVTPADLKRLEDEAHKQFKQLNKENIIIVDSKAELYVNQFKDEEDVEARIFELNSMGSLDEFVKGAWFDAQKDKSKLIDNLKQKSNFLKIDDALSIFGRKAHYIAMASLLQVIIKVYSRMIGDLESHIERFNEKATDPTELAKKIGEIKHEIVIINNKMYLGVDDLVKQYNGEDSNIRKEAESAKKDFEKKINEIDVKESGSFEKLEQESLRKIDDYKELQKKIQITFIKECDEKLISISDESTVPYTSLEPEFSEGTFKEIVDLLKKDAIEDNPYTEGKACFKKTKIRSEYSRDRHFNIVKDDIFLRLETIKNDLIKNLGDFVRELSKQYRLKLEANSLAKKGELDAIYQAKLNAEQIQEVICNISNLKSQCTDSKYETDKLLGGINKHV